MGKFKEGDVVILRSGGLLMTVEDLKSDLVSTVWFASDGILYRDAFAPEDLILVCKQH